MDFTEVCEALESAVAVISQQKRRIDKLEREKGDLELRVAELSAPTQPSARAQEA